MNLSKINRVFGLCSNRISIQIAGCFAFLLILQSCGTGGNQDCKEVPQLFGGKEITKEILSHYVEKTAGFSDRVKDSTEEVRFYVDKSSGINEAFSSPLGGDISKKQLQEIINNYRNAKYYSVLNNIATFDLGGADPTNYFPDGNNYEKVDGQTADLLKALNEITDYQGLSFFVTDGEQFDGTKKF